MSSLKLVDRKAKKLFDKNVAPILNLAGFEVTVVRVSHYLHVPINQSETKDYSSPFWQTEYEGQAKKFMDVLEQTDAILVAGGDGTLAEVFINNFSNRILHLLSIISRQVVTGLLRRSDEVTMLYLHFLHHLHETCFYV